MDENLGVGARPTLRDRALERKSRRDGPMARRNGALCSGEPELPQTNSRDCGGPSDWRPSAPPVIERPRAGGLIGRLRVPVPWFAKAGRVSATPVGRAKDALGAAMPASIGALRSRGLGHKAQTAVRRLGGIRTDVSHAALGMASVSIAAGPDAEPEGSKPKAPLAKARRLLAVRFREGLRIKFPGPSRRRLELGHAGCGQESQDSLTSSVAEHLLTDDRQSNEQHFHSRATLQLSDQASRIAPVETSFASHVVDGAVGGSPPRIQGAGDPWELDRHARMGMSVALKFSGLAGRLAACAARSGKRLSKERMAVRKASAGCSQETPGTAGSPPFSSVV